MLAAERGELAQPILPGHPDVLAEALHAARREQARTVGDVLLRRTRLGLTGARALCAPGERAPERVADAIGAELGWDAARRAAEVAAFRVEADAEGIVVAAA
jgi:glycerol-3-phosphate dehydrogenase